MTDKVQKIREEVEKLRIKNTESFDCGCDGTKCAGYDMACDDILSFIDSMQEEPVSEDLEKEISRCILDEDMNFDSCARHFANWQKTKDESTTEDLGEYINELSKQFPEVSFAKLSRIAIRVAKWQKQQFEKDYTNLCNGIVTVKGIAVAMVYDKGMADAREQMMKNIWKPADGDDLPEIDREVIALLDNGKVAFAHRPNPEGWDAKSIITEKVEHYTPETYGKGGWNIPDVKYWLDCLMPKEIEL